MHQKHSILALDLALFSALLLFIFLLGAMELTRRGLLLAKLETVYGLDAAPWATANNIAVARAEVTFDVESQSIDREIADAGFGRVVGLNALPRASLQFSAELRGNRTDGVAADISSGSSVNAAEIDPLLRACGMDVAYVLESAPGARNGHVYYRPFNIAPVDSGESVTFYFYSGLKLYKMTGCKGDLTARWVSGGFSVIDFTFHGLYQTPADADLPSPISWTATKPPQLTLIQLSSAPSGVIRDFEWRLGNQVEFRESGSAANALQGFVIAGRDSKARAELESLKEADHPAWSDWRQTLSVELSISSPALAGNRIKSSIFNLRSERIGYEERDGRRMQVLDLTVSNSAPGDLSSDEWIHIG